MLLLHRLLNGSCGWSRKTTCPGPLASRFPRRSWCRDPTGRRASAPLDTRRREAYREALRWTRPDSLPRAARQTKARRPSDTATTMHAAEGLVRRWNPWTLVLVGLTTGVYALERLLGVDSSDALVDAAMAGLISFVILEYWKG
jgi:hypothetical protein